MNKLNPNAPVSHQQVLGLAERVANAGFDIVKLETLRTFDGKPGFTVTQGQ